MPIEFAKNGQKSGISSYSILKNQIKTEDQFLFPEGMPEKILVFLGIFFKKIASFSSKFFQFLPINRKNK